MEQFIRQSWKVTIRVLPLCAAVLLFAGSMGRAKADDLYLLAATYAGGDDAGLGSVLYRLNSTAHGPDGVLAKVRDVVPRTVSTRFVEVDYDRRILIVASPGLTTTTFDVIKMDAPSEVVPSRRIPEFDHASILGLLIFYSISPDAAWCRRCRL